MKIKKGAELLNYPHWVLLRVIFYLSIVFLFLPIISIIVFSFNDSKRIYIWRGFSINNYAKVFQDAVLVEAFYNSLTIAFFATLISILLGTFSAYALWRFKFRLKSIYEGALSLPIVIPEIVMGISLLVFFNWAFGGINLGSTWPFNLTLITISHTTFCFPFVSMIASARLKLFNPDQIEAAFDLGASEFRAFFDVVIPFLKPAIISGGLLAFTLSLDDFMITFFTSGPNTITFPIKIYSMLRFSVTPVVNAASTMLVVITIVITLIGIALQKDTYLKQF